MLNKLYFPSRRFELFIIGMLLLLTSLFMLYIDSLPSDASVSKPADLTVEYTQSSLDTLLTYSTP